MKRILLILIVSISSISLMAQKTPGFVYCEIVGNQKLLSTKITVKIDFGEHMKAFADNRLTDPATGKVRVFNSMVDALNFMGKEGWECIQAYNVLVGDVNYIHYLMKKPFADLEEADKANIMKE